MTTVKTILCPVDFSDHARHALDYAADLASQLKANLVLVHAYAVPNFPVLDDAFAPTAEWVSQMKSSASAHLKAIAEELEGRGIKVEIRVVQDVAHHAINETAQDVGAGMVVMGTHGRTGLAHMLIGSVAEKVVRTSKIPVVTVPMNS